MATPGSPPASIAAFAFGNVLNAAAAALFLAIKGHGSSTFRDGKRLVLALFLFTAALWALTDFITTLIDSTAPDSCQLGAIFTNVFDQLARFFIEQLLLWAINAGKRASPALYFIQALIVGRLVLGGVFVGLTRSEFNPVCVPVSSVLIVAIVVVAVDAVIAAALAGLSISTGLVGQMQDGGRAASRSKAVSAVIIGLAIWIGTSVPMTLGVSTSDYILRTTLPAVGLVILIIIVTACINSLISPEGLGKIPSIAEASSPRLIETARSNGMSTSADYPPIMYEDVKREQYDVTAFIQPREVPMPMTNPGQGQAIPTISTAVTAGQGIGGMPVQGQLFPPPRAITEPAPPKAPLRRPSQEKANKSLFNNSKAPAGAITVGKLAISGPVLQQGGSNPLEKVATMDLETANRLEKERRAKLAAEREPPAPMPRTSTEKVVAVATASATGAQLSPATDELRRRSPRQSPKRSPSQSSMGSKSIATSVTSRTPSPPPRSAARPPPPPVTPGEFNATGIRPSRQLPDASVPEPLKTPLQRRATAGLPNNPRSLSVKRRQEDAAPRRQETIMFVNNIVYDDPSYVQSVMEGAMGRASKAPTYVSIPEAPKTTSAIPAVFRPLTLPGIDSAGGSVVNRPRPIPRLVEEEDGGFYPSHRRVKSAGLDRKSLMRSAQGSPTTLPPLPPPPLPGKNIRPLPNDTKSMTFNEKVKYLFPQQKSAGPKRRSSVPDMATSYVDMDDSPTLTDNESRDNRSKRTPSTVRTQSIFDEPELRQQREVSYQTYQGLIEDPEYTLENSPVDAAATTIVSRRASSPVLPFMADVRSATTMSFDEDDLTNFSTVYSPRPVQQVGLAVAQARAVEVTRQDRAVDTRAMSAVTNSEEMTIMLDSSVARDVRRDQGAAEPGSPIDDGSPVEERTSTRLSGPFHRRVGDDTLSFSTLSDKRGSRRGPPPTPLLLSNRPTSAKQAAMVLAAEASPLPSPEEALKIIQEQLKKYEDPDPASVGSPGRLALLNDLEAEMGQQETRWHGMQNALSRDSLSTMAMTPTIESRRTSAVVAERPSGQISSGNSSMHSNIAADRRASRRARLASMASNRSSTMDSEIDSTRASLWQRKLADAQMEYIENANELRKQSMNFMSSSDLASASPPDSDDTEDLERRLNLEGLLQVRPEKTLSNGLLWTPPQASGDRSGLMWVRPEKPWYVPIVEPPLPGLMVRPAQRKEKSPLSILSNRLWEQPTPNATPASGLWAPATKVRRPSISSFYKPGIQRSRTISGSAPIKPRPVTQRPPRRNKRITALPDIIEDPQPLPDKRGTLGIFQFPWGERSDEASIRPQSRFSTYRTMPGTMSTGGSVARNARAQQLEETEYTSSFFDDYDDSDEENEELAEDSSDMGDSDDDGFDESTLFEIANLLKADNVPSTNSMFGPSMNSAYTYDVYDDYAEEEPYPNEQQYLDDEQYADGDAEIDRETIMVGIENLAAEELRQIPSPMPSKRPTSLWETPREGQPEFKGLPQPEDWSAFDQITETARAKPRAEALPAPIESDELWTAPSPIVETSKTPLWTPSASPKFAPADMEMPPMPRRLQESLMEAEAEMLEPEEAFIATTDSVTPLWQGTEQSKKGEHGVGLPHPENWEQYDGVKSSLRAKPRQSQLTAVESVNLWQVSPLDVSATSSLTWASETTSAPVTRPVAPVGESTRLLWSVPASPKEIDSGLFDVKSGRTNFRTTAQAPAAVAMDRKPRTPDWKPLDRLSSTAMWAPSSSAHIQRNWLLHVSGSGSASMLWSAPAPAKEVPSFELFSPSSGRTDFRSTSQAPAAIDITRKPRAPCTKGLDRLTSTSLWVANAADKTERNWISPVSSPKKTALKTAASPEQWLEALEQAVAASYPRRSARSQASAADWAAALTEAVSKSYGKPFDVSKRHPVFAATSLTSKASVIHPAATGYTYDAAAVHPVFFGSGVGERAHPAVLPLKVVVPAASEPAQFVVLSEVTESPQFMERPRASEDSEEEPEVFKTPSELIRALEQANSAQQEAARFSPPRGRAKSGKRMTDLISRFNNPEVDRPRSSSRGSEAAEEIRRARSRSSSRNRMGGASDFAGRPPPIPVALTPQVTGQRFEIIRDPEHVAMQEQAMQQEEMSPEVVAQIEALEQERLFAVQWATGSFEQQQQQQQQHFDEQSFLAPPADITPAYHDSALSTPTQEQQQPFLAEQLAPETTATRAPPARPKSNFVVLGEAHSPPQDRWQPMTAERLASQLGTPEDFSLQHEFSPSSSYHSESPSSEGPRTPSPASASPNTSTTLERSNTVRSAVSELSESGSDGAVMRDSLVSVESDKDKATTGYQMQFIY